MRVGYVVHTYPGLSLAFVQREVLGLRRAGVEVHTFSVHRAEGEHLLSPVDREEASNTESLLPPAPLRIALAHLRALRYPRAYWKTLVYAVRQAPPGMRARLWQVLYFAEAICLWAWADRVSVDHLHAHLANVATDDAWLASVFDRFRTGRRTWTWSFTIHGPTEFFAIEKFNLARKASAADGVICISDFCRSQMMLLSPPSEWDKLTVVHCGADLDRYKFRPPRREPSRRLKILYVGRLVTRKGPAVLLQALARLPAGPGGVSVTFVGSGPALDELTAVASRLGVAERVTFAGPCGQDQLPDLMADHDALCLPSFSEGVPVVLMEAMAVGLPVVATTIAGVPELITDGVSGLLVPPGRADALSEALARLAADPDLRARLARAGRSVVEARFDGARCAVELAGWFDAMRGGALPEAAAGTAARLPGPGSSAEKDLLHDV